MTITDERRGLFVRSLLYCLMFSRIKVTGRLKPMYYITLYGIASLSIVFWKHFGGILISMDGVEAS